MVIFGFKQIIKNKVKTPNFGNDTYYYVRYRPTDDYSSADAFFQFNIFNPYRTYNRDIKRQAYQAILDSEKPFLVCEEGFFRKFPDYKKFGWYNYKNNLGLFNNENPDDSRWKRFQQDTGFTIKDWNSPGDNILIIGQLDGDSSLIELYDQGFKTFNDYIVHLLEKIRQHTDRPIIIRPHPLDLNTFFKFEKKLDKKFKDVSVSKNYKSDNELSGGEGLQEDLKRSYCVVTYNSNTAAEIVEQGIPFFTMSFTSSAYEIGHKDLSNIENLDYGIDTTKWCHKIAYTVWNSNETTNGSMWEHLKNETS